MSSANRTADAAAESVASSQRAPSTGRLRLFRTTAFKLAVGYLIAFFLFAAGLIGYMSFETSRVLIREVEQRLTEDVRRLSADYRRAGIPGLRRGVEAHSARAGNRLFLLTDPTGRVLAGNVEEVPVGLLDDEGLVRFEYQTERRPDGSHEDSIGIGRVFMVDAGYSLLIGRDIRQSGVLRRVVGRSSMIAVGVLFVLALLGWFYVNRRVLKRIDGLTASTGRIMDGDLGERLPITGNDDEFDRLAANLNVMLARLETLMNGLKEVSDNIAHDLKTPLTRLRNEIESALARPREDEADQEALEKALSEADRLIGTFQALLMIGRVQAGGRRHTLSDTDLTAVVTDVAELYDAVAEDRGATLTANLPDVPLTISANRELLGLAVANLIDNALKHGDGAGSEVIVALEETGAGASISVRDFGPGIPEADLERVRERFVRLDKSRTTEGAGLGLALVQAVADFHEGSLALEDAAPGLMARIDLPRGVLQGGSPS